MVKMPFLLANMQKQRRHKRETFNKRFAGHQRAFSRRNKIHFVSGRDYEANSGAEPVQMEEADQEEYFFAEEDI